MALFRTFDLGTPSSKRQLLVAVTNVEKRTRASNENFRDLFYFDFGESFVVFWTPNCAPIEDRNFEVIRGEFENCFSTLIALKVDFDHL